MSRPKGLIVLDDASCGLIYGPDEVRDLESLVELLGPAQTRESIFDRGDLLGQAEVLISGWGGPCLDERFLELAPQLRAVFYGGGSLAGIMTDAAWRRGIVATSAWTANAVPVAEYTLATILFSLKHGWRLAREARESKCFPPRDDAPGCYQSTVGLISLGAVARELLKLLRPFDLKVLVHDPFLARDEADRLGVEPVSLKSIFERADVVSLHAPGLPETRGMITGKHLASLRPGVTFINTARGEIVREDELIAVATNRPDLQFVLDVTEPEPPTADSPLYTLPNVVLTPHISGSAGNECRRMGRYMVEELRRFVRGEPLQWVVTRETAMRSSHRPMDLREAFEPPVTEPVNAPRPFAVAS